MLKKKIQETTDEKEVALTDAQKRIQEVTDEIEILKKNPVKEETGDPDERIKLVVKIAKRERDAIASKLAEKEDALKEMQEALRRLQQDTTSVPLLQDESSCPEFI